MGILGLMKDSKRWTRVDHWEPLSLKEASESRRWSAKDLINVDVVLEIYIFTGV